MAKLAPNVMATHFLLAQNEVSLACEGAERVVDGGDPTISVYLDLELVDNFPFYNSKCLMRRRARGYCRGEDMARSMGQITQV